MICKRIPIEIDYEAAGLHGSAEAHLDTYIIEPSPEMQHNTKRPALVICPGGGYAFCSEREGEPVARAFAAAGYQTFVLWYAVDQLPFPCQLLQAAKAVAIVRAHAQEWCIDPDNIVIAGFSAGGHLAASLGVLWNRDYVKNALGYQQGEHRPNGMILSYPVITSGEFAHRDSFKHLLLDRYSDELLAETSLEKQVSADTVPAFIWHTYPDGCVPVENTLMFASAMKAYNIPLELHIFPDGNHGMSIVTAEVGGGPAEAAAWVDMAIRWMSKPH